MVLGNSSERLFVCDGQTDRLGQSLWIITFADDINNDG